jgi:hypothetical protein
MLAKIFNKALSSLLLIAVANTCAVAGAADSTPRIVPVTEEPLHVVKYRDDQFLIYTNWIEPGVWTLYHAHENDLMAVIVADTMAASQTLGESPREQAAPAGALVFFPYADDPAPFVHRVSASGNSTFINVGLEFLAPPSASCTAQLEDWNVPASKPLPPNRRGQGYHLTLAPGATVAMPRGGRGLLLAPLAPATLQLANEVWTASVGQFRLYTDDRPEQLQNAGGAEVTLVVFDAC